MLWVFTILVLLFLVLPVLIIVPMSFSSSRYLEFPPPGFSTQWYQAFFGDPQWVDALRTSLELAVATTLISLVLGVLAAEGLSKSEFKGKSAVIEAFMMPMLVPGIIVGIAIYRFEAGMSLSGSFSGLLIAHVLMAVPFVIRTVLANLEGYNPNYELASRSLGANSLVTFLRVTVPMIRTALFSGAMFAFATSFDEIVVSQFICGVEVTTLPKRIWDGLNQQLDPTITAIAAIVIVLISLIMIFSNSKTLFGREPKQVREELPDDE
jgi:putative spermidine/putrescine transport system permease protein